MSQKHQGLVPVSRSSRQISGRGRGRAFRTAPGVTEPLLAIPAGLASARSCTVEAPLRSSGTRRERGRAPSLEG